MSVVIDTFRKTWKRLLLRRSQFRDLHQRLDLLYRIEDPWDMSSEHEQFRFRQTNRFLLGQLPVIDSLLEIGCGEGHQTAAFQQIAKQVSGIDVSASAIARAKQRCPGASFTVGDIANPQVSATLPHVSVVTACEVLYYVSDVRRMIDAIERHGDFALVTYFNKYRQTLDPVILNKTGVTCTVVEHGDLSWTAALWKTAS